MKPLVIKIYDDEGRTKFPKVIMKKLGLTKGSLLLIERITNDKIVLRKLPRPEENLKSMGPELPPSIDEDKVFEELDVDVYYLIS